MARHGYDDFDREMMRDRRGGDPREMRREQDPRELRREQDPRELRREQEHRELRREQEHRELQREQDHRELWRDQDHRELRREQDSRDRLGGREHRRIDPQDPDRRDDWLSIDLQSERREGSSRYPCYFLPGEGINREVIQIDICRYLGNDATVRPYEHQDGRRGFLIKAYRALTTEMIQILKQDSKGYESDAQRRRQIGLSGKYGQEVQVARSPNSRLGMPYGSSATFDDREQMGRPDFPQPGYAGYSMDATLVSDSAPLIVDEDKNSISIFDDPTSTSNSSRTSTASTISRTSATSITSRTSAASMTSRTSATSVTSMSILDDLSPTSTSPWPHMAIRDRLKRVGLEPGGQLLASASWDRTVRLWDSRTGASRGTLKGHSQGVNAVAFSPMEFPEAPTPSEEEAARQESNRAVETKSAPKEPGQSGSVMLNREQPPDSISECDVTFELKKEADANHPIGSATRGDSKQGLPEVLPEETTSLAANLAGVATVTDSLASNISPVKSKSFEPMRRRGMSEPLENPFTRLDQAEAWIRDVDPVEVATIGGGTMSNPSPEAQESSSSKLDIPLSGITSSQESADSMDSDLLSVSESSEETESLESLDQNEAVFPILREALEQLLRGFSAIKKTVNEHQPSSGKRSQASVASTADYSTPSQSSKADLGRKRQRAEEDEEQDQADAALSRRARKKLKPDTAQPRFLACPYWKRNPNKHRRCCKLTLKRIRDVKQHLHRRHTPEFYCERCFVIFPNNQSHQDHIISVLCRREPHVQLDGISHSQHRELCRKSNPAFTEENQWFAIWDILFPGSERPFSAYIDSELSADLCLFREHWQNSGQDVLLDVLRSNQWVSMSAEERETQGRRILAEGLDRIYEDWLSSRSSATTESQSAASSAGSSSGIARAGSTRSLSSETLATSVASVQLRPPAQASGAEMLEKDPNDVSDSAREETAPLSSDELENTGLTISNGVEVADLPGFQSFQEINIDEFLASGWEEDPRVMDPRDIFGSNE